MPRGDSPEMWWRQRRELRPGSFYNKPSMNWSSFGPNAQHLGVPVGPIVQVGTQGFRLLALLVNMGSPGLAAPELAPLNDTPKGQKFVLTRFFVSVAEP